MANVFSSVYANAYDSLYHDKDYSAECDMLESIFRRHASEPIKSILDLGCGTGNHVIPLAKRGYQLTGVDVSEEMLTEARRKSQESNLEPQPVFFHGDICSIEVNREFDAALLMFAVLSYQIENANVLAALQTARKHLRRDGLLIMDFWYGPAVLTERPSDRLKIIPTEKGKILRAASGKLEVQQNTCSVGYHLWELEGDRLKREVEEEHSMRYFFKPEIEFFLQQAGFSLLRFEPFMQPNKKPDETIWNVLSVAQAV